MKKSEDNSLIMMIILSFVYFMIWWFKGVDSIGKDKKENDKK